MSSASPPPIAGTSCSTPWRVLPPGDAARGGDAHAGRVVRAHRGRSVARVVACRGRGGAARQAGAAGSGARHREGPHPRQLACVHAAGRGGRRRAADRRRPAIDRADRGPRAAGDATGGHRNLDAASAAFVPPEAHERPSPAGGVPLPPHGAQGRRRRQRGHARMDPAAGRPRRRRPTVPPGEGGPALGAGTVPGARAATTTTRGGSSRASG